MNIKLELIERERIEYIKGNAEGATFLGRVLDHVIELEAEINRKDAEIERLEYVGEHEK